MNKRTEIPDDIYEAGRACVKTLSDDALMGLQTGLCFRGVQRRAVISVVDEEIANRERSDTEN
jgi:hypothetical protein